MKSDLGNVPSHEGYFVEIDGTVKFEYRVFVEALKACLQLKHEFPNSTIKLRDADESPLPRRPLVPSGQGAASARTAGSGVRVVH
jgi:hypothetical protein